METIYNGSVTCEGCPHVLTPVEVLWGRLCPACARKAVQNLIRRTPHTEGNDD